MFCSPSVKIQRSYSSQINHGEKGNSAFVENLARGNDHLPEAQTLSGKILARSYWESNKCGGQHVITFQIAVEIRLIFKEIAAVGSRMYQ